ncbi:MAG TPA: hypothetical protein DDE71_08270 [Tenacibaculum sp.]|nr:hypothetical protein [Tenacibaculum sp.]
MKEKILFLIVFCIMTLSIVGQSKINNYKYVIVPNKFEFLKKKDQYQTSSLTKFLFEKYGFNAYLDSDKLPEDLNKNRCLALTGVVKDASSMFTTKSLVELRDCYNKVVFTSTTGKSKVKEYKKAYHESIRNAFLSLKSLGYKYSGSENKELVNDSEKSFSNIPKNTVEKNSMNNNSFPLLYAQPLSKGYQLIDEQPKKVFVILKTDKNNVFILRNKTGIVYKVNDYWKIEYYEGDQKIIKQFNIKF